MLLALNQERFPFQYRGKKLAASQVELLLKFKDIHSTQQFNTGTPLGDFVSGPGAPGLLNIYVTQAPVARGQQPPAPTQPPASIKPIPLTSTPVRFNGAPYGNSSAPLNLGYWWLQVFTGSNYIGAVAPTLVDSNNHLLSGVMEDIFLVCHYSAS